MTFLRASWHSLTRSRDPLGQLGSSTSERAILRPGCGRRTGEVVASRPDLRPPDRRMGGYVLNGVRGDQWQCPGTGLLDRVAVRGRRQNYFRVTRQELKRERHNVVISKADLQARQATGLVLRCR
jgi:hypothetical protein